MYNNSSDTSFRCMKTRLVIEEKQDSTTWQIKLFDAANWLFLIILSKSIMHWKLQKNVKERKLC